MEKIKCDFEFVCNKDWESLDNTDQPRIKHCNECNKNVVYCETDDEFRECVDKHECVCVNYRNFTTVGLPTFQEPLPEGPEKERLKLLLTRPNNHSSFINSEINRLRWIITGLVNWEQNHSHEEPWPDGIQLAARYLMNKIGYTEEQAKKVDPEGITIARAEKEFKRAGLKLAQDQSFSKWIEGYRAYALLRSLEDQTPIQVRETIKPKITLDWKALLANLTIMPVVVYFGAMLALLIIVQIIRASIGYIQVPDLFLGIYLAATYILIIRWQYVRGRLFNGRWDVQEDPNGNNWHLFKKP